MHQGAYPEIDQEERSSEVQDVIGKTARGDE
jgi:hypothetical protein